MRDLRKSYGDVEAVRGVSFEVARGEVFCLLGPNGAGKTTIVEILEGYRVRDGGDARVLGHGSGAQASASCASASASCSSSAACRSDLTVAELVEMYGRYHDRAAGRSTR